MLYLSLGSNIEPRTYYLSQAISLLEERVGKVCGLSHFYETKPVGFRSVKLFLNAAAVLTTDMSPEEILVRTQQIERELGRTSKSIGTHYADRTIDIDLLLIDGVEMQTPLLTLPHPRMADRRFVLEPLYEIAPQLYIPTCGQTVAQLLQRLYAKSIERVTPAHVNAALLTVLNKLLPQLSTSAPPLTLHYLQAIAQSENVRLYVLRGETGEICATATLTIARQITGEKAWVEDLVVDSSCRGKGYARQLLRFLESEAIRMHLHALNLTSRPEREAANSLYQHEDYQKRKTNVYRKSIPESS